MHENLEICADNGMSNVIQRITFDIRGSVPGLANHDCERMKFLVTSKLIHEELILVCPNCKQKDGFAVDLLVVYDFKKRSKYVFELMTITKVDRKSVV